MADEKIDPPFDAPWVSNLAHRPDPNRVQNVAHRDTVPQITSQSAQPQSDRERSYYDIPILKKPVWKWEVASYFFLGGMSAGAYLLGRAAERTGGETYRDLTRMASYVAMASLIPCPPLLIADLGDPKRFHHMLRIWKPSSPMSLGTWSIVAYSGVAACQVVRQFLLESDRRLSPRHRNALLKLMNNGTLLLLQDAAGVSFSLLVAGYTGVLLSCTSNPLWSKNSFLGPLFSASAIATGAEAVSLALDLFGSDDGDHSHSQDALRKIDTIAHVAELALMRGFTKAAGEKARPLTQGAMKKYHETSMGGIVAAEAMKLLPFPRSMKRPMRVMWNVLGLTAGLAMRWGMVMGGREAAADPHLGRASSRLTNRRSKRAAS